MKEYLYKHRSELARNKIDTQDALEEAILCGSWTREDDTVDF